jgi:heme ABC exporter ATP-binding subunit CcmA/heme exporter protein CcmB
MIDIVNLSKQYGPNRALTGVSLHIDAGECVIVAGPNGAGKTTMLRIVGGLVRPTFGSVRVGGIDLGEAGPSVRRQIGYLSHRSLLYDDLTAEQNLSFYARIYGVTDAEIRIRELLDQIDLTARRSDLVRTFSRGMKQRLAIARAIIHRPTLLLLDEPYTGLDPIASEILDALLGKLSVEGCTQLMSTHRLETPTLSQAKKRILVLIHGRIAYDGSYDATFADRYRSLVFEEPSARVIPRVAERSTETHQEQTLPVDRTQQRFGAHVWAIASKDLTAELHTREIISAMFVFAVLALFIFSFTLDLRGTLARAAAPGVLWSTIAFTGMLGLNRSFMREHQTGGIEGLRAAPVEPTSIFFGKALSTMALMLLVELVLIPLTAVFLNVPLVKGDIIATLLLGTLGYAAVGTLLSAIAVNTRAREVMLPILLLPIIIPLFLSAVQTTRGLLGGATWTELTGWTQLLVVYDLVIVAVSMVMFRYTLEE